MIETKKGILRLFLFFSILCFGVLNVEAESIDISKTSSITLVYQYENEKFSNVNASLYQLATFDINGQYKFNNLYEDVTFDPVGMTASDLNLKATEIINDNKNMVNKVFFIMTIFMVILFMILNPIIKNTVFLCPQKY